MEIADDEFVLAVVESSWSMHLLHQQVHFTREKSLKERKQEHKSAAEIRGVLTHLDLECFFKSFHVDGQGKVKALKGVKVILILQNLFG